MTILACHVRRRSFIRRLRCCKCDELALDKGVAACRKSSLERRTSSRIADVPRVRRCRTVRGQLLDMDGYFDTSRCDLGLPDRHRLNFGLFEFGGVIYAWGNTVIGEAWRDDLDSYWHSFHCSDMNRNVQARRS